MFRTLWKTLGSHALCGAAVLAATSMAQGQQASPLQPPVIPAVALGGQQASPLQPPVIPAVALGGPTSGPIQQVGAQDAPRAAVPVIAQPTTPVAAPTAAPPTDEKARIERLEKELQEMKNLLQGLQTRPAPAAAPTAAPTEPSVPTTNLSVQDVRSLVNSYLAEQDAAKKVEAQAIAADGYKVGTDLSMNVRWKQGLTFETPNKDFSVVLGVYFQYDMDWFHQSKALLNSPAKGGVNPLIDAGYFRRIFPSAVGNFWEIGEFSFQIHLENIGNGAAGLDDTWIGVKNIPLIGSVRVGHFHLPHGLEADMYTGSKPLTFFEVSSANNAFFSQEKLGSGVLITNAFLNQRMTYAATGYRPDNALNGDDFSQGDYAGIFRLTGLPIYENDGRCLMHIGGSATYRHARTGTVAFGATPQINDFSGGDNGYGSPIAVTTAGVAGTVTGVAAAPGNRTRWVDTGAIPATASTIYNTEFLYIKGPFSLQAEYDWAYIDNAVVGGKGRGNLGFTGGYIAASYFLTGENRTYDKRLGRLGSEYIAAANTPFWFVRGEDGRFNYGLGAWELVTRFSRLDVNDGPVRGGIMDSFEAGVNWHLNNHCRVQFLYNHTNRYDMPVTATSGWMNALGIRTMIAF